MKFPKRQSSESSANLFFKLKDGESKSGVLRGELFEFYVVWSGGKSTIVPRGTEKAKARFRVNLVVYEEGKFLAKIWEISQTVCNQLADLAEEYDLSQTKIKISRRGSGPSDTEYSIIPILKDPIQPHQMKQIEDLSLNILEHKAPSKTPSDAAKDFDMPDFGPMPDDHDEIPF
jgi:hypothetical protein